MHAMPTLKHWMHQLHDEGIKIAHYTGHMVHEKSFWGILAFVLIAVALFTLLIATGNDTTLHNMPIYPYYLQ